MAKERRAEGTAVGAGRKIHAVAASLPLLGHAYPTVRALQDLLRRGHRVTILCSEAAKDAVQSWPEAEGMDKVFLPDIKTPQELTEQIKFKFEHGSTETGFGRWARIGYPVVRQALQELNERHPVDVVVADQTSYAFFQAADDLGIPSVANCPGCGFSVSLLGYQPPSTASQWMWYLARLYDRIPGLASPIPICFVDEFIKFVRGRPALINCTAGFSVVKQYAEDHSITNICRFTGSLVEARAPCSDDDGDVRDSRVQHFLDKEPFTPVVLLSMGSTQTDLPAKQMERVVRGATAGPWRTIVTLHEKRMAALPADLLALPDVHFSSWIPQAEVLSHPRVKAFVTHCGWGATIEALSAGVPVVCLPCFGDQPMNAKILVEAKHGVRLNPAKLKAADLTAGIEKVLLNTEIQEAARQNQAKVRMESGGSAAASEFVEALATGKLEVPPRELLAGGRHLPLGFRPVSAAEASLVWGLAALWVGSAAWCVSRCLRH